MTNSGIALVFEQIADLLEQQAASSYRVHAWRQAAQGVRDHPRPLGEVFRDHGRIGLDAVPHIGPRIASVAIELIRTGRSALLDRLRGDLGIDTPEDVEHLPRRVPVRLLLEVDRHYRVAATASALPCIAPLRFNPSHEEWLPILHTDQDGWAFTALFSNTALAHQLGRTRDWVVILHHEAHGPEARATVVTEREGPLRGRRVVRGRELECLVHYAAHAEDARAAG